jgi:hypothetical protein
VVVVVEVKAVQEPVLLAAQAAGLEMIVVVRMLEGPVHPAKDLPAVLVQHLHTKKPVVVVVVRAPLGRQPLQVPVAQAETVVVAFNIVYQDRQHIMQVEAAVDRDTALEQLEELVDQA